MDAGNNLILNRVFTQSIFKNLLDEQHDTTYSAVVRRYINNPESKSNRQLISEIYHVMKKNYRNEYFYKNTILNNLLLGRHSLRTTTALSEIPIAKSKADFILINGKAIVYEIKTELDTFERLESQLNDYYKAFSNVCVVTCKSNHETILKRLENSPVGICLLTERNTLSRIKDPVEDTSNLDSSIMFKILRKSEYESIIQSVYGKLPEVTQFNYYSACKKLFCGLELNLAYKYFLGELKKRHVIDVTEYTDVPYELKSLVYFSKFRKKNYQQLERFLKNIYGG